MSRAAERLGADADAFMGRCQHPHHVKYKVDLYAMAGGLLAKDVPIVGGRLEMDSSDPTRRRLEIEVAGEEWIPESASSLLVPFGQYVILYVTIDRQDGTWFPWMKMGEFPVVSNVVERPSTRITVEAEDYSATVNEYRFLRPKSFKGVTLKNAVTEMANAALPDRNFTVHASDHAKTSKFANYIAQAGRGRWDVSVEMSQKKGQEAFFDWNGDLVIRYDRTQDDEETITGVGPDIGTVSSPIATIKEGEGGNLVGLTATVTRRGGMNGVQINRSATVTRKVRKKTVRKEVTWSHFEGQETGAAAWGDAFGRIPIVDSDNVDKITEDMKRDLARNAKSLLRRRLGVVRYIDMDVAPQYWLEPDDTIRLQWAGRTEHHYVQRVVLDLSGRSPMRVRTRQLSVTDPGREAML